MNVVAWARVSGRKQKEEKTIRQQVDAILKFAKKGKYTLEESEIFSDDGRSGDIEIEDSDGLVNLLKYLLIHPEKEAVIITEWDRLARDFDRQIQLRKRIRSLGRRIICISEPFPVENLTSDQEDEMEFQRDILGAVAAHDKRRIKRKLKNGKSQNKREGLYNGGWIPYGFKIAPGARTGEAELRRSKFIVDEEKMKVVKMIFELRSKNYSLQAIAKILNDAGIPPRDGGIWYHTAVRCILRNPIYKEKAA